MLLFTPIRETHLTERKKEIETRFSSANDKEVPTMEQKNTGRRSVSCRMFDLREKPV